MRILESVSHFQLSYNLAMMLISRRSEDFGTGLRTTNVREQILMKTFAQREKTNRKFALAEPMFRHLPPTQFICAYLLVSLHRKHIFPPLNSYLLFPVKPTSINITSKPKHFASEIEYSINCEIDGSIPETEIRWTQNNRPFKRGKVNVLLRAKYNFFLSTVRLRMAEKIENSLIDVEYLSFFFAIQKR